MEYSVGSLADLISGFNTPNKPKVIKKEFTSNKSNVTSPQDKEPKKALSFNTSNKPKGIKKEFNSNVISPKYKDPALIKPIKKESNNVTAEKVKKIKNKSRKKISEKINIEQEHTSKGKRSLVSNTEENEDSFNTDNKKPMKGRKRKLDSSVNALPDSDSEMSPPKEKLSKNDQNAKRRVKKKAKKEKTVPNPEELARTIFVGNIPINIDKKKVKQHFRKYGIIESIRVRGIPVEDPKVLKKVAAIKKKFNPNRSNVFCYIKFQDSESAQDAEAENGALFEDHHLRVHCCLSKDKPDETKAIFVGNLSFDAVEDELWSLFESCGPISYVRIVRDQHTGMGKGFAYVNFKDSDAVQLALEMENVKLKDRELRISLCNLNGARRNKKRNNNKKITKPGKSKSKKNYRNNSGEQVSDRQQGEKKQQKSEFQGTKFSDKKKKQKVNRGLLEKKKVMRKIAPIPK